MTNRRFPIHGRSWDEVRAAMEEARRDDLPWYNQRMFKGGSYYGGADVVDVANDAYRMYINYNALFANTMFPSLARYEAEIVGALLEMLNAPEGAGGSITTGGTESIMMAVKTAREWAGEHCFSAIPSWRTTSATPSTTGRLVSTPPRTWSARARVALWHRPGR